MKTATLRLARWAIFSCSGYLLIYKPERSPPTRQFLQPAHHAFGTWLWPKVPSGWGCGWRWRWSYWPCFEHALQDRTWREPLSFGQSLQSLIVPPQTVYQGYVDKTKPPLAWRFCFVYQLADYLLAISELLNFDQQGDEDIQGLAPCFSYR